MVPTGLPSRPSRPISVARSTTARSVSSGAASPAAEVLGGEPLQVLAEVDEAEAVDRLGRVLRVGDAVVKDDDVGPRLQVLGVDRLQQRESSSAPAWGSVRGRGR